MVTEASQRTQVVHASVPNGNPSTVTVIFKNIINL